MQEWARGGGLIFSNLEPEKEGGREHDLRFSSSAGRWWKFTKPHRAGYAVQVIDQEVHMLPAGPLQYLRRWILQNSLFGDDVMLCGLTENGCRIVVSQSDVTGDKPGWAEIELTLQGIRLHRLDLPNLTGGYDSRAYFGGRLGVFDVRPSNCLRTESGLVAPIDFIPQLFSKRDSEVFTQYISVKN